MIAITEKSIYLTTELYTPTYQKEITQKKGSQSNLKNSSKLIRLKNKKGYLEIPCKKYPQSYALKHWQLGKSWLISNYFLRD